MTTKVSKPIISFKSISLKVTNKTILDRFNLDILPNEKIVIYGPSGIGKSSLVKLLLGFIKPNEGLITVQNRVVDAKNIWTIRQNIAYVDQDATIGNALVKTVFNESFSLKANKTKKPTEQEIAQILNKLFLETKILKKPVAQLSGGERQRVALAIALLLNRPIMILDEATAALDPKLKQKIINFILTKPNQTLISIAHDPIWQKNKLTKVFNFKTKTWEP